MRAGLYRTFVQIVIVIFAIGLIGLLLNSALSPWHKSGADVSKSVGKVAESISKINNSKMSPTELKVKSKEKRFEGEMALKESAALDVDAEYALKAEEDKSRIYDGSPIQGDEIVIAVFDPSTNRVVRKEGTVFITCKGDQTTFPLRANSTCVVSTPVRGSVYEVYAEVDGVRTNTVVVTFSRDSQQIDLWVKE